MIAQARCDYEAKRCGVEPFLVTWTNRVAELTEAVATIIIAGAVIEAAIRAAIAFTHVRSEHQGVQVIRWRFGRWLSLALDFLIASDILRTGVSPSWIDIGQLAAIVLIRIAITWSITRETKDIEPQAVAEEKAA